MKTRNQPFNKRLFDKILSAKLNKGRKAAGGRLSDRDNFKLFKSAYPDTYNKIIEAVEQYEVENNSEHAKSAIKKAKLPA